MRPILLTLAALAVPAALHAQNRVTLPGDEVAIYNVVGTIRAVAAQGGDVEVTTTRNGRDGERLGVARTVRDGIPTLRITVPDDEDRLIYPAMGDHSRSTIRINDDGTFGEGGWRGGREIDVRGSGRGLQAWADLEVAIPAGRRVHLNLGVGGLTLSNVDGQIMARTMSGNITSERTRGSLRATTGSGNVRVTSAENPHVTTGSGDIVAADLERGVVRLTTGSGNITVTRAQGEELRVQTGSGNVRGEALDAAEMTIGTGSGSIRLALSGAPRRLRATTGSGDVNVLAARGLDAEVSIMTGSGDITSDLPLTMRSRRRNELVGTIGNGTGSVAIRTGSGSVHLGR